MKSLPAYIVTMLTRTVTSKNEMQKNERGDYTRACVAVVHRRPYSALHPFRRFFDRNCVYIALGLAPQALACLQVLATG